MSPQKLLEGDKDLHKSYELQNNSYKSLAFSCVKEMYKNDRNEMKQCHSYGNKIYNT